MASILRQIVAGPRSRHPEAGLDLCYVTDNIIATSGPSSTYPQRAYRNPTDDLVKFLDKKHGEHWWIWEFRAEGTGYPDSEVYGRVRHYPWPDHHPPPFCLIPNIMASMRDWLQNLDKPGQGEETGGKGGQEADSKKKPSKEERVVVIHCKAGKGRSGTVATSYLISEEGWEVKDALERFTARRMRAGFGEGVSIPSQLRWVNYVDFWTKNGKRYVDRPVEILEIHLWGLREGVRIGIDGFVEDGKKIKNFHTFSRDERLIIDGELPPETPLSSAVGMTPATSTPSSHGTSGLSKEKSADLLSDSGADRLDASKSEIKGKEVGGKAVIFRAKVPIRLSTSDICIDIERRNRARYGWTMVTAVAHVWFNVYFEGAMSVKAQEVPVLKNPEAPLDKNDSGSAANKPSGTPATDLQNVPTDIASPLSPAETFKTAHSEPPSAVTPPSPKEAVIVPPTSGVFTIRWDALDGLKGSSRKGMRAFDKMSVVWRAIDSDGTIVKVPEPGDHVPQTEAADWKGEGGGVPGEEKEAPAKALKNALIGKEKGNKKDEGNVASVKAVGEKMLGLRIETPQSGEVSKASSLKSTAKEGGESGRETPEEARNDYEESLKGVKTHGMSDDEGNGSEGQKNEGKASKE